MRSELGLAYAGVRVRQGEFADGAAWCRRVLDEALPDDLQAIAHAYYLMHLAFISNRSPERAALRGLALPIYAELGDLLGQANVLNNMGVDAYYEGRWREALELYESSKAMRERIGDVVGAATITNNIGEVKSDQGYLTTAAEHADAARVVFENAGHRNLLTHALSNLGRIAAREGRLDDSRKLLHQAREVAEEISAAGLVVEIEARLAERAVLARETEDALAGAEQALAAIEQSGEAPAPRLRPPDPRLCADAEERPRRGRFRPRQEPRGCPGGRRDLRARAHTRGGRAIASCGAMTFRRRPASRRAFCARLGVVSTPSVPL